MTERYDDYNSTLAKFRSHWSIENSLNWVLDVTFNKDKSRIQKKNGPENMAIVRHTVLNLLRKNGDTKNSLKRRR